MMNGNGNSGTAEEPEGWSATPRSAFSIRTWLSRRRAEITLFLLLWVTYAYFYQASQHNEAARFDQTRAIVEKGVLYIEAYARKNTADIVVLKHPSDDYHIYPNKAPGTSLLAIPSFWLWMHALQRFPFAETLYWHLVAYLTTLSTVTLLSVLAAVAMFAMLRRMTGHRLFSALTVVAVWLGTICFPFSTLFFSHQPAAAQLVLAFWVLFRLRHDGPNGMRWVIGQLVLAGFLCGFSVATEYPTILLVLLLCAYFGVTLAKLDLTARARLRLCGGFVGGLAVGGAILVAYNLAAFGKIFYVPYEAYAQQGAAAAFPGHAEGYVGMHWPGWTNFLAVLKEITVRPQRGLLYIGFEKGRVYACSPVLWLALPGLVWLLLRKPYRLEAILVAAMAVAYLTFNACYGDSIVYWGGAWSVGPRHLVPLLPFLALPLVEGARRLWFLFYPLLLISMFYMLLATAVEPRVPYEYPNPARDLFAEKYLDGRFALNRLWLFGSDMVTADSTAFNLGKLGGLSGPVQLDPLLLFWLVAGAGLTWAAASPRRAGDEPLPLGTAQPEADSGANEQASKHVPRASEPAIHRPSSATENSEFNIQNCFLYFFAPVSPRGSPWPSGQYFWQPSRPLRLSTPGSSRGAWPPAAGFWASTTRTKTGRESRFSFARTPGWISTGRSNSRCPARSAWSGGERSA